MKSIVSFASAFLTVAAAQGAEAQSRDHPFKAQLYGRAGEYLRYFCLMSNSGPLDCSVDSFSVERIPDPGKLVGHNGPVACKIWTAGRKQRFVQVGSTWVHSNDVGGPCGILSTDTFYADASSKDGWRLISRITKANPGTGCEPFVDPDQLYTAVRPTDVIKCDNVDAGDPDKDERFGASDKQK